MLNKITATNFQSWSELEFSIESGIKLVDGWNEDDQTSEGSGKSAVLNAISWGGFGQIPKDAKIDEVIKDGETSCRVTLHFENGDYISRSRKPNDLFICKSGGAVVKGKDAKETQELIEEYLGMNFDTFCQSVYFAQNYDKKFLPGNPETKGKILANIQNTSIFDKARKEVMELAKNEEKKVATLRSNIQIEDNNLVNVNSQKSMLQSFINQKIAAHQQQLLALRSKRDGYVGLVESARAKIALVQSKVEGIDLDKVQKDEQDLTAVRPEYANQLAEVSYKKSQIDTVARAVAAKEAEGNSLANKYKTLEQKLQKSQTTQDPTLTAMFNRRAQIADVNSNAVRNRLVFKIKQLEDFILNPTKNCPSCGSELKSVDTSHTQKELELIRAELVQQDSSIQEDLARTDSGIEALKVQILESEKNMAEEMNNILIQLQGVSDYLSQNQVPSFAELQTQEAQIRGTIQHIDSAMRQCQELKSTRMRLEGELNLAVQMFNANQDQYVQIEQELSKIQDPDVSQELEKDKDLSSQLTSITEKRQHLLSLLDQALKYQGRLETLKDGFKEIKSFVFSNALKELNIRANEYLSELFEVEASIKFTNDDQKIESTIVLDGQERGLGLLSGGQNRRFNLSVDLALSDLVSNRKSSKLNLLILDEYFKDLSEVSMEKCLDLLKTRKSPVVLIEHNTIFKNIVDNTFFVRLENGTSCESRP